MGKTSQSMGARYGTVWVLLVVLLTAGVLATKPGADEDVAKEINEAIDNDMQLGAASSNTPTTFADLKPYLGAASKERWASKAVADIRGLSENQMAVSSVSENELNFARDAEEAKDVVDETVQMAEMKKTELKQKNQMKTSQQICTLELLWKCRMISMRQSRNRLLRTLERLAQTRRSRVA